MALKKPARKIATGRKSQGFTDEERAAMQERVRELKAAAARRGRREDAPEQEREVLAKIAEMPQPDRAMAERIHVIVRASAPALTPKLWYGMPAYASDGNVVCFFQGAYRFKARYATLGFSDKAKLDDGAIWPVGFALHALDQTAEARIAQLVKRAVT